MNDSRRVTDEAFALGLRHYGTIGRTNGKQKVLHQEESKKNCLSEHGEKDSK